MTTVEQAAASAAQANAANARAASAGSPPRKRATDRRAGADRAATLGLVGVMTWTVSALSGLCLAFVAFLLVLSPLQQSRAQDLLYTQFRSQLAAATAPFEADPIDPGAPVAIMEIDGISLRQVVVEGTAGRDLRSGPGHARDSAFPGQPGTAVVMGRSTTYGAPFADIASLGEGDQIRVVTGQGAFSYRVEDVRRDGDVEPPALEDGQSRLTLITTTGDLLRPSSTIYVDALLRGDASVAPPRQPLLVPPFESAMATDTSALLPLVLWLLALLATAAFVVWGVVRWGRLQTWVIAFPVALAALWGACDCAALLLPNLM